MSCGLLGRLSFEGLSMSRATRGWTIIVGTCHKGIEHFYYVYVLTELYSIRETNHPVTFEPSLTHCRTYICIASLSKDPLVWWFFRVRARPTHVFSSSTTVCPIFLHLNLQ